jgi:hypothetical protein
LGASEGCLSTDILVPLVNALGPWLFVGFVLAALLIICAFLYFLFRRSRLEIKYENGKFSLIKVEPPDREPIRDFKLPGNTETRPPAGAQKKKGASG